MFGHAIRKLDALIGAPRHEIVSTGSGIVAIGIAPHEHNVGVAADGQRALDVRDTEERGGIVGEQPRGVSEGQPAFVESLQEQRIKRLEVRVRPRRS